MAPAAIVTSKSLGSNHPEPSSKFGSQTLLRHKGRNGKSTAAKIFPSPTLGQKFHTGVQGESESKPLLPKRWCSLPDDIQDAILVKLDYKHLFQAKVVSKLFKTRIESDGFHGCRGKMLTREAFLTALHFSVGKDGVWQCTGYDLAANTWRRLPPFDFLPKLDPALFKDHAICAAGGIMCANVSTSSSMQEEIVVFNPMTRRWRKLPPLNHPRNPVLMHMLVDPSGNSYKVIVAGSARAGHEHLSKITEVFDSRTSKWTVTQELPGPVFALNEHQTGVCVNGILFCIAFLDAQDSGRGLIAYKVDEGKWLPHLTCRLPNSTNLSIVQVVASNGEVVVFSEIERNPYVGNVEHRIDVLEKVSCTDSGEGLGKWRNVMRETKAGNQAGLQTYPEYTCVPFGDGKLCIFNTIAHTGIVYDVRSGDRVDSLSCPTCSGSGDMGFYSMNPVTFSFEPSFKGNPNLT
ncbi:hypothetical protein M758_10G018400 [Ceratodon purpureus]|nr:hypothetical protein M758_10G018400 [Ceratodon purpureus]